MNLLTGSPVQATPSSGTPGTAKTIGTTRTPGTARTPSTKV